VAKVFEKPVAVKKSTDNEHKKSKKDKKKNVKNLETALESPVSKIANKPLVQDKVPQKKDLVNGKKSKSKKTSPAKGVKGSDEIVPEISVNKMKYLSNTQVADKVKPGKVEKQSQSNKHPIQNEQSPNTSHKSNKKHKGRKLNTPGANVQKNTSPNGSIKNAAKSVAVNTNGVAGSKQPKTPQIISPKKQNSTEIANVGDMGKIKKHLMNQTTDSPRTPAGISNLETNNKQIKTPKQNLIQKETNTPKSNKKGKNTQKTPEKNAEHTQGKSETPINKKKTPGTKFPQTGLSDTPKTSKGINAPNPLNSSKHSTSNDVSKNKENDKKSQHSAGSSPTTGGKEKQLNQKKKIECSP